MSIKIKLYQHKRKDLQGKWYGRAVKAGEVTTKDLARIISANNSVTESDVHAVIFALVQEMKHHLRDGQTVVLDGFGRGYSNMQHLLDLPIKAVKLDSQVLIDYITETLGGVIGAGYEDPYGQGRIVAVGEGS